MKNSKKRRHSGRKIIDKEFDEGIDYRECYDEWNNYRDGYRRVGKDRTKKQPTNINKEHYGFTESKKVNKKIKKNLIIRKKKTLNRRRKILI